jgi:hypothetical protein
LDVGFRLLRPLMEPIAAQLMALKAKQGDVRTAEDWLALIRQGVFAYQAQGGGYLTAEPEFFVSLAN